MRPDPTLEELALARRVLNTNTNYVNGWDTGQVNFRRDEIERCVLAAIRETTDLAAKLIEANQIGSSADGPYLAPRYDGNIEALHYAITLRTNAHLKGQADE